MPKKLVLLRHADAEQSSLTGKDITRPLSARGLEVAAEMARRMKDLGVAPDLVLCSTAARTVQTARIFMKTLGTPPDRLINDAQLYNADPGALQAAITNAGAGGNVSEILVVAHNPGISKLAYQLSAHPGRDALKAFYPAGFAILELRPEAWGQLTEEACLLRHFELP